MQLSYRDNENELLTCFLDELVFCKNNNLKIQNDGNPDMAGILNAIEVIVRPECNQQCEYCYIARHGQDLYPMSERVDKTQLLKNFDMLLDYVYHTRQTYIRRWELFAGDLFYDNLYFDMMDIFRKYAIELNEKYPKMLKEKPMLILVPCNFSFIDDDVKTEKLHEYIEEFLKMNIDLGFSVSTDGKYAIDTREGKTVENPDERFEKIFQFLRRHPNIGTHPMISASNVHVAIQNHQWFREMYKKYFPSCQYYHSFYPSYLEVRNDEWNDEQLEAYRQFLLYITQERYQECHNNIDELAYHLFCGDGKNNTMPSLVCNDILNLPRISSNPEDKEKVSCSIQNLLHITLNNFSIVPCHRLTYQFLKAGNLVLNEDKTKIIGLESYNTVPFIDIHCMNAMTQPKCSTCLYNPICMKGCFGAQYEASGELFMPAEGVCKLLRTKYNFLIHLFNKIGVLSSALKQGLLNEETADLYRAILKTPEAEGLSHRIYNFKFEEV